MLIPRSVANRRLVPLLLALLAPVALAEPRVFDPSTGLSLDLGVLGDSTCVTLPDALYEPQACQTIPRKRPEELAGAGKSLHLLAAVQQPEATIILTLSSITRPGIGQMSDRQIRAFLEGTMKRLAQEFGAQSRLSGGEEAPYTLQRIGGVPVVRWEYVVDLPATAQPGELDSGVAYLIPSRDTLDILSLNTERKHLPAARALGEQLVSTLKVPLTVDAERFGEDASFAAGLEGVALPLSLLLAVSAILVGWLWRRRGHERARKQRGL